MSRWPVGQNVHLKLQELAGSTKTMKGVAQRDDRLERRASLEIDSRLRAELSCAFSCNERRRLNVLQDNG